MTTVDSNKVEALISRKQRRVNDIRGKGPTASPKEKEYCKEEMETIAIVKALLGDSKFGYGQELGKTPPKDLDLEEAILGCLMLQSAPHTMNLPGQALINSAMDTVAGYLKPEHFSLEAHRRIYEVMIVLNKAGVLIDMKTVAVQLKRSGHFELVGGARYIAELTTKVSSTKNLENYCRFMIELWMKRELVGICNESIHRSYDDTADVFEILQQTEERIQTLKPCPAEQSG